MRDPAFSDLLGKTLTSIEVAEDKDAIAFLCDDGSSYKLYHEQECCEDVIVEDVTGDLADLIGNPILQAEEISSSNEGEVPRAYCESWTWTFYKLATIRGSVTIRWFGESNGYYSEEVSFAKVA